MKMRLRDKNSDNIPKKMKVTRQRVFRHRILIIGLVVSNLITLSYIYFNNLH